MANRHLAASLLRLLLLYTSLSCVDVRRLRSGNRRVCFYFLIIFKEQRKILFSLYRRLGPMSSQVTSNLFALNDIKQLTNLLSALQSDRHDRTTAGVAVPSATK